MRTEPRKRGRGLFGGTSLSPRGFLLDAAMMALVFLLCHLMGLREHTTILSGTSATGDLRDAVALGFGLVYVLFYFAFVIVVPILVIASGVFLALQLRFPGRKREPGSV